ncbi:hypothetical protein J3R30DRAFT_3402212 [Lentinula aciculospora]|uniref:Uncharacterized protein n=1 Tax=Lentinula aciculospora TaxID=153920 RepID=A0A9W9AIG4_9AGAR|nr:hypothetical protein J3R30DRAFT_3402212 [Lentinula aciculospora]
MTTTITQEVKRHSCHIMYNLRSEWADQYFPMELCELLQTLSLGGGTKHNQEVSDTVLIQKPINVQEDVAMFDDQSYQSDTAESDYSSTSTRSESYGCAYLQAIKAQLDTYTTTGGEYLEAIFTHREILSSYPKAHQECARGFSDIAYMLEQRAWRADRDADVEAVTAFRHEAWSIAATMTHYTPASEKTMIGPSACPSSARSSPVCVMQPAW